MAKVSGIDELINKLTRMNSDIDDDVDEILRQNAKEFTAETVKEARRVMVKGYWTGNLARMVEDTKRGQMSYVITSNAHYSGFLEYGTRYMAPETFMRQVYNKFSLQIVEDLERLLN
ncbi:HK97-gp10 family putative phage morphogenesis protein [Staphylococcus pseudoxylosus]|uniref:HK97-gp10 family putative phage morphogenesis protein n=1 Tax=Staphylococcus pseudoxylosus TaxID=2282419 RepID=UPI002DBBFB70|nr:HK97-gp10 family putative phage morphogenesis protein [Staphylococcus pseudoxylosus]MEB7753288.1 HK97 gp10 family phage protein [Staphylococcus pseudoxylosus]